MGAGDDEDDDCGGAGDVLLQPLLMLMRSQDGEDVACRSLASSVVSVVVVVAGRDPADSGLDSIVSLIGSSLFPLLLAIRCLAVCAAAATAADAVV